MSKHSSLSSNLALVKTEKKKKKSGEMLLPTNKIQMGPIFI